MLGCLGLQFAVKWMKGRKEGRKRRGREAGKDRWGERKWRKGRGRQTTSEKDCCWWAAGRAQFPFSSDLHLNLSQHNRKYYSKSYLFFPKYSPEHFGGVKGGKGKPEIKGGGCREGNEHWYVLKSHFQPLTSHHLSYLESRPNWAEHKGTGSRLRLSNKQTKDMVFSLLLSYKQENECYRDPCRSWEC